ncbi:ATPase [Butyrivibrio sp. WCD3002]|uniref:ATPase n=1 Tax=Butyrivibrio sp. WCD3002 TaxID=1280676 RepID=UPI0004194417|nr:ATPase [Butyrivibrio sp. WCD3002]
MKKYTLIAGVNGAGKTTLYQMDPDLKGEYRVNADEILKESGGDWRNPHDVFSSGRKAVEKLNQYFEGEESFNQETTLCGNTVFRNIRRAKEKGFLIEMHYVGVASVDIAKERVAKRVLGGGHGVNESDIERRYEQSLRNFWEIMTMCNLVAVYDNTDSIRRFAIYKDGVLVRKSHRVPEWFDLK